MTYLIIGAGGTGGCIGAYLARNGHDVEFIARGAHLKAMQANGLVVEGTRFGSLHIDTRAYSAEEYAGKADVIFICVKAFSLCEVMEVVQRAAKENTIVVPILNGLGMGDRVRAALPNADVLDACLYISAHVESPGIIQQSGRVFRIVCGNATKQTHAVAVDALVEDCRAAGIDVHVSDQIKRDQFRKFMFVSPLAASQSYYGVTAGALQKEGPKRDLFIGLTRELNAIGAALSFEFPVDMVEDGKKRLDTMLEGNISSLYLDLKRNRQSEVDVQILDPIRLGKQLHVETPLYEAVANKLGIKP